jgi:hypothetical protein
MLSTISRSVAVSSYLDAELELIATPVGTVSPVVFCPVVLSPVVLDGDLPRICCGVQSGNHPMAMCQICYRAGLSRKNGQKGLYIETVAR